MKIKIGVWHVLRLIIIENPCVFPRKQGTTNWVALSHKDMYYFESKHFLFLIRCIVRALKDPNTFLFDHLLALKPVKFLEGELIHDVSNFVFSEMVW